MRRVQKKASIAIGDYVVSIVAGHHQPAADETIESGGKDSGPRRPN